MIELSDGKVDVGDKLYAADHIKTLFVRECIVKEINDELLLLKIEDIDTGHTITLHRLHNGDPVSKSILFKSRDNADKYLKKAIERFAKPYAKPEDTISLLYNQWRKSTRSPVKINYMKKAIKDHFNINIDEIIKEEK